MVKFDAYFARALAGIWFALAASVATWIVLITIDLGFLGTRYASGPDLLLLVTLAAIPASVAALCGSLLGHTILDARKVNSSPKAAVLGLIVGLVSLLIFALYVAVLLNVKGIWGWLLQSFAYFGWLVAIVGAVAGWLLYSASRYSRGRLNRNP